MLVPVTLPNYRVATVVDISFPLNWLKTFRQVNQADASVRWEVDSRPEELVRRCMPWRTLSVGVLDSTRSVVWSCRPSTARTKS